MGDAGKGGTSGGVEAVVRTAVATLYSNLVTRPTGQAVRCAIEEQVEENRCRCLSILDFSHVGVLDYSCADEVIAKLLSKYMRPDRPSDCFFVVQGVSEHHRDQIDAVLHRHNLLLVAIESGRPALLGPAPARLRRAWNCLDEMGRAVTDEFASARGLNQVTAGAWLRRLVDRRVAVPDGQDCFSSLPAIVDRPAGPESLPAL
jgi:hypothetical protein